MVVAEVKRTREEESRGGRACGHCDHSDMAINFSSDTDQLLPDCDHLLPIDGTPFWGW